MTYDEFNNFCGALPATSYVVQWGGAHVWKVGGKVFAIGGWSKAGKPAFTFKVSALHYDILQEEPGYRPAPYLASRGMKWIQQYDAPKDRDEELKYYLKESYRLVLRNGTPYPQTLHPHPFQRKSHTSRLRFLMGPVCHGQNELLGIRAILPSNRMLH